MDQTCRGHTLLVVGVDDDDPALDDYLAIGGCRIVTQHGLRGRLVDWLNVLSAEYAQSYRYLGHIGDDNIPSTDGWDVRVVESLAAQGDIGFCFGDDLDPGRTKGSLTIHIFMTSEVVRRLGYMGPPSIAHMYVDVCWQAWGTATSLEYLPDVILEHRHYSLGKAKIDESYAASTALIPADCGRYHDYCRDTLNDDIRKLGGRPYTPEALADFNRMLNIPAEWP